MFKKLLIILALSIPLFGQHITGTGTSGNPYILYNGADVDSIRYLGIDGKYYELANDIDLSTYANWVPIQNSTNVSIFSLDGNGYSIKHLTITSLVSLSALASTGTGLFQGRSGGGQFVISNLTIDSSSIIINGTAQTFSAIRIGFLAAYVHSTGKITKVAVKNSKIVTTGNTTSMGSTYVGFLIGDFQTGTSTDFCFIKECLAERDSLSWNMMAGAVYPTMRIGGLVGFFTGGNTGIFEANIVRYNYFYSRGGSVNRSNVGGGFFAELNNINSVSHKVRYNYTHSNYADYGSGGSPTNHPWGWGGMIGHSNSLGSATYTQNYTAYNQCLGTNSSAGFIANDAGTGAGIQVADSTYNFVDITSFAEPNTVYGTRAAAALQYPAPRTSDSLKQQATYAGWDFVNIWRINPANNLGYPTLYWEVYTSYTITSPLLNETYFAKDTIDINWTSINADTTLIYYTDDNEFSWNLIDSTADDGNVSYQWVFGVSGTYKIKLVHKASLIGQVSDEFFINASRNINILSPVDSSGLVVTQDSTIDIIVETLNVDQFTLFYALGDTTTWILIAADIPTNGGNDTVTYVWDIPNIFGVVFLKASEISDTTLTDFEGVGYFVGNTLPSSPTICWENIPGLDVNHRSPIQHNRWVDNSCGWAYNNKFRTWSVINNDATGYVSFKDDDYENIGTVLESAYTYQYTLVDTTAIAFANFFSSAEVGDSILYKQRKYYVRNDSLWCTDELNSLTDILILDLTPFMGITSGKAVSFHTFSIYNVQRDTLINHYYPSNQDYEALNNPFFKPLVLLMGDSYIRGTAVIGTLALPSPQSSVYVEDVIRMFESLSYRRDYFRGIDPKARKSGR